MDLALRLLHQLTKNSSISLTLDSHWVHVWWNLCSAHMPLLGMLGCLTDTFPLIFSWVPVYAFYLVPPGLNFSLAKKFSVLFSLLTYLYLGGLSCCEFCMRMLGCHLFFFYRCGGSREVEPRANIRVWKWKRGDTVWYVISRTVACGCLLGLAGLRLWLRLRLRLIESQSESNEVKSWSSSGD